MTSPDHAKPMPPNATPQGGVVRDAQDLGRRGFRVHPLRAKDAPYTKYSQTATSDPDAIARLFAPFPNALIGICTGQGLVVVDDDRRTGLDAQIYAACDLVANTPKGGVHYYFSCPTPVRNSAGKIAEGIDVRGEGGYVVAPPSEGRGWVKDRRAHGSGCAVRSDELLSLPGILLAACLRSAPSACEFEPRTHVPAGERHDYLVRFAGWALANELSPSEDLYAAVLEHAEQICDPWPRGELPSVHRHIREICRWVIAREGGER